MLFDSSSRSESMKAFIGFKPLSKEEMHHDACTVAIFDFETSNAKAYTIKATKKHTGTLTQFQLKIKSSIVTVKRAGLPAGLPAAYLITGKS